MKKSFNRRVLRLLTVLAVLSGVVIVALFFFVARNQIRERATETLRAFAVDPGGAWDEISPEIYFVSTDETGDETLTELDQRLLDYYLLNGTNIPLEKVCHFTSGKWEAYFFARAAGRIGERSDGVLLIYTDVSFSSDLVRTAAAIMAVVVLVLSILLYCVERYTVKALDSKDKGMKDFFANASHELKTPLMAIRSYADGLESGLVEQGKACSIIVKEADRMTSLVNDILEFSKLDSGTVQPHMAENDVREILYDAIQVIEQTAEQRGIEIVHDLPIPMLFTCDEEMLFSAFSNILTNSVRYAESCINITALQQKSPAVIIVRISNDGWLISEQDKAHLFERFYKGNKGQTGIGMALSLEYIRLHQGNISVSVCDGNTVFEVRL
jgi:signal transduction histidine kinase